MSGLETLAIPLITSVGSAGAAYATSQLTKTTPPAPQPVAARPDPNDPAIQEERRRRLAEQQARSGRDATDLVQPYSNSVLGS